MSTNAILVAIMIVESGLNPMAYNPQEKAAGILQIRPQYVSDCNRIVGYKRFSYPWDCFIPTKSIEMFHLYTEFYGAKTWKEKARIHNGGPKGCYKEATLKYWTKVQKYRK